MPSASRKPKTRNADNQPRSLGRRGAAIEWCPPATAEGALTHTDWARFGWRQFTLPRGGRI